MSKERLVHINSSSKRDGKCLTFKHKRYPSIKKKKKKERNVEVTKVSLETKLRMHLSSNGVLEQRSLLFPGRPTHLTTLNITNEFKPWLSIKKANRLICTTSMIYIFYLALQNHSLSDCPLIFNSSNC